MEKMGWSKGKGLGANEDGNKEHVAVSHKVDRKGVGAAKSYTDDWIAHQDDFSALLANLNQNHGTGVGAATGEESNDSNCPKVISLEQTSKSSRGRVHYKKFTKGKDLSLKSENDLDCVFGKRRSQPTETDTPQSQSEANSDASDMDESYTHGLKTVTSTDSVQGYFARKMEERMKKLKSGSNDAISDHTGSIPDSKESASNDVEGLSGRDDNTDQKNKKKKAKKSKKRKLEEGHSDFNDESMIDDSEVNVTIETDGKVEKAVASHQMKRVSFVIGEDVAEASDGKEENSDDVPERKKRKKDKKKPKRERNELEVADNGVDVILDDSNVVEADDTKMETSSSKKKKSKKSKKKKMEGDVGEFYESAAMSAAESNALKTSENVDDLELATRVDTVQDLTGKVAEKNENSKTGNLAVSADHTGLKPLPNDMESDDGVDQNSKRKKEKKAKRKFEECSDLTGESVTNVSEDNKTSKKKRKAETAVESDCDEKKRASFTMEVDVVAAQRLKQGNSDEKQEKKVKKDKKKLKCESNDVDNGADHLTEDFQGKGESESVVETRSKKKKSKKCKKDANLSESATTSVESNNGDRNTMEFESLTGRRENVNRQENDINDTHIDAVPALVQELNHQKSDSLESEKAGATVSDDKSNRKLSSGRSKILGVRRGFKMTSKFGAGLKVRAGVRSSRKSLNQSGTNDNTLVDMSSFKGANLGDVIGYFGFEVDTESVQEALSKKQAKRSRGNFGPNRSRGNFTPSQQRGNFGANRLRGNFGPNRSRGNFGPNRSRGNFGSRRSRGNIGPNLS